MQLDLSTFRAYGDNVLVRVEEQQGDTAKGALVVAPPSLLFAARDASGRARREVARSLLARVVSVGPGHYPEVRTMPKRSCRGATEEDTSPVVHRAFVPTEVRPGDLVALASQLSGDVWHLDGGEHRMVREAEILAVIEEDWEDIIPDGTKLEGWGPGDPAFDRAQP